jgi:thiol-disulfide isomerase/thioredoxin
MKYQQTVIYIFLLLICANLQINAQSTPVTKTSYRAEIKRADNYNIVFNIVESISSGKISWIIRNSTDEMLVNNIKTKSDSLIVELPFFDASLLLKKNKLGYVGEWKKRIPQGEQYMPISIERGSDRLHLNRGVPISNVSGRWRVSFTNPRGQKSEAMAELKQVGLKLTGTFLTPTGDYRFLEGIVKGDSLMMTTFDGSHAYFFSALISSSKTLDRGLFASGPTYLETWTATRDANMVLDETEAAFQLKGADNRLNFRFPDLNGNLVGINDPRFNNKVVIVQIMGSWCPNCMDETSYLSQYYKKNRQKGVEVIGLAFEYSTDFSKAKTSLNRFKDRFSVDYPMLITGVTSSDTLRTEKTLPQMTPIIAFPSMIFIGKDGTVRKTHAGYSGPATGVHYEDFKKEFDAYVNILLNQK